MEPAVESEVEVAEVREDDYEDEDLDRPRSRITAGPVIAVIVVVIIVSIALFYALSDSEVSEITIIQRDFLTRGADERYGVQLEIRTLGGIKSIEGTGSLDVLFKGRTEYSTKVDISNDMGTADLEFEDFLMENGNYTFLFSMDGVSEEIYFLAKMVPHSLNVTVQYGDPFSDDPNAIMLVATPEFDYMGGEGESIYFYSPNYDVTARVERPDGTLDEITRTMEEWNGQNRTLTKVWHMVDPDDMGHYKMSAELTNNLVKTSSSHRTITSDQLVDYINRAPEITDVDVPSTIREGSSATFTFKAMDPDQNGGISYYSIDWDDGTDLEMVELGEGDSTTIRMSHSWDDMGDYTLSVTCADNGYVDDNVPPVVDRRMFDTESVEITVRFGI